MNRSTLLAALAIGLIWGGSVGYLDRRIETQNTLWHTRQTLLKRYEALKERWSQPAQKAALAKFEALLKRHGIQPAIQREKGKRILTFTLPPGLADKVLNRLMATPLAITALTLERDQNKKLHVRLEIAL